MSLFDKWPFLFETLEHARVFLRAVVDPVLVLDSRQSSFLGASHAIDVGFA